MARGHTTKQPTNWREISRHFHLQGNMAVQIGQNSLANPDWNVNDTFNELKDV